MVRFEVEEGEGGIPERLRSASTSRQSSSYMQCLHFETIRPAWMGI